MFITLEGIEGSGKTSQIPHITDYLESRGHVCLATREPGGTAIGARIRSILLDPECSDLDPATELMLYTADRVQHVRTLIRPALDAGRTVLCDRYVDATVVYQGMARGLDPARVYELHDLALGGLMPDLTLLLDLPPATGLQRAWRQVAAGGRSPSETRFEKEKLAFHEKVRAGYLNLARRDPDRFRVVDAGGSEEQVRAEILKILGVVLDDS